MGLTPIYEQETLDELALSMNAVAELTINSGAVTVSQIVHTVDTESDAASDDLDTITAAGNTGLVFITAANASRTITVKHGTGNILLGDGADVSLDDANKGLWLAYDGSNWHDGVGEHGYKPSGLTDNRLIRANGASDLQQATTITVDDSDNVAGLGSLAYQTATELTISSGAVTVTKGYHKLQPETSTADDLDTISGLADGEMVTLYASDAGTDTITVKHGTGNISCLGGADIELSEGGVLAISDGTTVYAIGGGGVADGSITTAKLAASAVTTAKINDDAVTHDKLNDGVLRKDVNQSTHGLAVGDMIRHNGTNWVQSQADSASNAEVFAIVTAVADADNFTYAMPGAYVTGLSGLTAGEDYYLDPSTAGAITTTAPSTAGQVVKPIGFAVSTTVLIFAPLIGTVVGDGSATFAGTVRIDDTTDATDATGGTGALGVDGGVSIAKSARVGTAVQIGDLSSFTPNTAMDELVIGGSSGSRGLSVLTSNNAIGFMGFGDTDDSYAGGLEYDHNLGELRIQVENTDVVTLDSTRVELDSTLALRVGGQDVITSGRAAQNLTSVNTTGTYSVSGTQVVGARQTGWGAPTGTATRTTFATGSVTLSELAERVHALIDDLTTHGLIGS